MTHDQASIVKPLSSIVEPPQTRLSEKERRWSIIRWLSFKMGDAPYDVILEAAHRFEDYFVGDGAGQATFISSIAKLDPKTGQILSAAAQTSTAENDDQSRPAALQPPLGHDALVAVKRPYLSLKAPARVE